MQSIINSNKPHHKFKKKRKTLNKNIESKNIEKDEIIEAENTDDVSFKK